MKPLILEKIWKLRQELAELVATKGLASPEVLATSQKLDQALIDYYHDIGKQTDIRDSSPSNRSDAARQPGGPAEVRLTGCPAERKG